MRYRFLIRESFDELDMVARCRSKKEEEVQQCSDSLTLHTSMQAEAFVLTGNNEDDEDCDKDDDEERRDDGCDDVI